MALVWTATHGAKLLNEAAAGILSTAGQISAHRRFCGWVRVEKALDKVALYVASQKKRAWVEHQEKQSRLAVISARAVAR